MYAITIKVVYHNLTDITTLCHLGFPIQYEKHEQMKNSGTQRREKYVKLIKLETLILFLIKYEDIF